MYCKNCGNQLSEGERFCSKCGAENVQIVDNVNLVQNVYQSNYQQEPKKKSFWKIYGKLWVGIFVWFVFFTVISIFLRLAGNENTPGLFSFLQVGVPIILVLTGWFDVLIYVLVCNSANKFKNNSKIKPEYLTIGILLLINILIIIIGAFSYTSEFSKTVVGTWNCKQYSWSSNSVGSDYVLLLELDKDSKFNMEDKTSTGAYVKGNYSYNEKETSDSDYKKYSLELTMKESNISSVATGTKAQYEMQLSYDHGYDKAVLMNYSTYNAYYCERE